MKKDIRERHRRLVQPLHGGRRRLEPHARQREQSLQGADDGPRDCDAERRAKRRRPTARRAVRSADRGERLGGTVYAHHTEEDMNLALSQPWCSIGSDGSALATEGPLRRGNPHPRNFGTFPRVLGVYVRERGLLRLEDAVRKMTSLNAAKLGLGPRPAAGRIVRRHHGLRREAIIDRATYTDPFQLQRGHRIRHRQRPARARQGNAHRRAPGTRLRHESASAIARKAPTGGASPVNPGGKPDTIERRRFRRRFRRGTRPPAACISPEVIASRDSHRMRTSHQVREPSGGANGLLFDHQGRLRRVRSAEPARDAHRGGRHDHCSRRFVRGQSVQLAERRGDRFAGTHLFHGPAVWLA